MRLWGCFSYHELGLLTEVTINMNQEVYLNILNDQVLPFSRQLHDEYVSMLLRTPFYMITAELIGLVEYVIG